MIWALARSGQHGAEVFDTLQHFRHRDPTIGDFVDLVESETTFNDLDPFLKGSASEGGLLPDSAPADDDAFSTELIGEEVGPNSPIEIKKLPVFLLYHRGGNQPNSTEVLPARDLGNYKGLLALVKGGAIEEARLKDDWAYTVDNDHVSAFFEREPGELPQLPGFIVLCQRCKSFKAVSPGSQLSFSSSDLDSSLLDCGLFKLLHPFRNDTGTITISRAGVALKTSTSDRWILRICADPGV
ncbi:hypothetical protein NW767_013378 [Fusarium falciforme]|nr:hypothetical protein NW767_013378 [Fusarium falciforme]